MEEIVPFSWDALYLFEPYTPISNVCKSLGIPTLECSSVITRESVDDGEMYMVFTLAGSIVHQEMYIRFNGDFTPISYPGPIKKEKSKFFVVNSGEKSASGEPWLKLVPVSALTSSPKKGRPKVPR